MGVPSSLQSPPNPKATIYSYIKMLYKSLNYFYARDDYSVHKDTVSRAVFISKYKTDKMLHEKHDKEKNHSKD